MAFGALGTWGCHFFNPDHPTYLRVAAIARVRNRPDLVGKALRRGHLYFRETSCCQSPFFFPPAGEIAGWAQILYTAEVVMALNTHGLERRGAWVTVDSLLHPPGSTATVYYRSDWHDDQLREPPAETLLVQEYQGRAAVWVELLAAGMLIFS